LLGKRKDRARSSVKFADIFGPRRLSGIRASRPPQECYYAIKTHKLNINYRMRVKFSAGKDSERASERGGDEGEKSDHNAERDRDPAVRGTGSLG
jgi:hypothetical protein